MNADPAELQKFSELAHRWWDPQSEFRPLHEINPLRLEWINGRAPLSGKRALDVGCGGGILAEAMAKKGATVTGIDLSEKALKVADLHSLESGIPVGYEYISAEDLAAREAGQYDVVTCMEMLEHVPEPAAVVQACASLVKPGGHVFFSTINRNLKAYLFCSDRCRIYLAAAAQRYARLRKIHHTRRAFQILPNSRTGSRCVKRNDLQPDH